jgi:hypothetical protein
VVTATLITSIAAASVVSALNRTRPEALDLWIKIGYHTIGLKNWIFHILFF